MKLGDFHSEVSTHLKRGNTQDAIIPAFVRRAARWIERNYTLQYMRRYSDITLSTLSGCLHNIPLPHSEESGKGYTKSIERVRIRGEDGYYYPLHQCDPNDVLSRTQGRPERYWLDGLEFLWFDKDIAEDFTLEFNWVEYTKWPTDPEQTHWLLCNAEDAILAQTLILIAPIIRNPDLIQMWKPVRDEGIRTLILADEEFKDANRSETMAYGRIGDG